MSTQALGPISGDPLLGANPTATGINPSAPIGGSAQGMPAPKSFGSYTNSPTSNALGDWGKSAETGGIPGDSGSTSQGGSGGYGSTWQNGAPGGKSGGGGGPRAAHSGLVSNGYGSYGTARYSQKGANAELKSMLGNSAQGQEQYQMQLQQEGKPSTVSGSYGPGNSWSSTIGAATDSAPGGAYGGTMGAEDGGPIPSIPHTSKKVKGYDDGGSVDDSDDTSAQGGIPDPGDAIPSDPTDPGDVSNFDPGSGQGSPESNAIMQSIYKTLSYGRQKNGLSDAIVTAAYNSIPTKPAGPGGDQTRGGPQDRSNQIAGNIPTKPAGPGGDQTRGGPQDRGNQTSQNDSDNDDNYPAAAGGGFMPSMGGGMGRDSGMGRGSGMGRDGGERDMLGGVSGGGGGGDGGGWNQTPDLSRPRTGGFMAMKKGGAIPEEDE